MEPRITCGPLQNARGLTICTGVSEPGSDQIVSATGVDPSPEIAHAKCRAEFHERVAILRLRSEDVRKDGEIGSTTSPQSMARLNRQALAISEAAFGSAAGRTACEARENAVHELVERWRGRLWWSGQAPPLTPSAHVAAQCEAALKNWRAQPTDQSGLLVLMRGKTRVVALAWSCRADGARLRTGLSCAENEGKAAMAALQERVSMEFGLALIIQKKRHGLALSSVELSILQRAEQRIDVRSDARFHPIRRKGGDETPDPEIEFLETEAPDLQIAVASDRTMYSRRFGDADDASKFAPDAMDFLA